MKIPDIRVFIPAGDLVGVPQYPREPADHARARLVRTRLSEAGVPVRPSFSSDKVDVQCGHLLSKRDSRTGDLSFIWKPGS